MSERKSAQAVLNAIETDQQMGILLIYVAENKGEGGENEANRNANAEQQRQRAMPNKREYLSNVINVIRHFLSVCFLLVRMDVCR